MYVHTVYSHIKRLGQMKGITMLCAQIGGVVMRSPFVAIAAYERELGLPVDYINTSM